jgi:hypothetical protein
MTLSQEALEFNEKQKRLREYYQTEGRGLDRLEDELKKLRQTIDNHMGFLIDTLLKWIEDDERRKKEEYKRSSYGMWDPYTQRTRRDYGYERYEPQTWPGVTTRRSGLSDEPIPPYDPDKDFDPDKDSFDEGAEEGKGND